MPMVAVSHPYCFAIGRIAMLMLTLSILHSMKAMKHRPMMVHLLFHLLPGLTYSRKAHQQLDAERTMGLLFIVADN